MLKYAKINLWGIPEQNHNLYTKQKIRFSNNMNNRKLRPKRTIKANRTLSMTLEGWLKLEDLANEWHMTTGRAMEAAVDLSWSGINEDIKTRTEKLT